MKQFDSSKGVVNAMLNIPCAIQEHSDLILPDSEDATGSFTIFVHTMPVKGDRKNPSS